MQHNVKIIIGLMAMAIVFLFLLLNSVTGRLDEVEGSVNDLDSQVSDLDSRISELEY